MCKFIMFSANFRFSYVDICAERLTSLLSPPGQLCMADGQIFMISKTGQVYEKSSNRFSSHLDQANGTTTFQGELRMLGSRDSVVGIATGYGLDDRGVGVRVPVGWRIFYTSSRPVLGPTQPPIQWVPGRSPWSVKLTTYLQLVPRSGKCGSIHPRSHTPSWRTA
jgi:hypothetical protein